MGKPGVALNYLNKTKIIYDFFYDFAARYELYAANRLCFQNAYRVKMLCLLVYVCNRFRFMTALPKYSAVSQFFFSIGCGGGLLHWLLVVSLFAFSSRPSKERLFRCCLLVKQKYRLCMCVNCVTNERRAKCSHSRFVCVSIKVNLHNCFCDYFLRLLPKLKIYFFALALVFLCFFLVVII